MERIAIAVDNNRVSEHFGRCPSFMIVELNKKEVVSKEKIPNPGHRTGFLPEFLGQKGIHTIICGGMGRRAQDLFLGKNVKPIVGVAGEIDEVIEKYINGELKEGDSKCYPGAGKGYGIEKEDHYHNHQE